MQNARHSWLGAVKLAAAIGIAYLVAARLGLALRTDGLAVFWPAAGIAVGALIILGPNARLPVSVGVILATIVANLMVGRNIWVAITFGLLNAAEANITAWLIWRWFGSAFKLDDVRQVLGFMVASAAGGAVSALGSAAVIGVSQAIASPLTAWRIWFAACLLGTVTIAPVLIGLGDTLRKPPPRRELVEGALGLATLATLSAFLMFLQQGSWESALPVALVFPILLWVAIRCRPVFAAAAVFVVAFAIIWSATANMGHYGDANIPVADRILAAQTHVLAAALLALVIAALFADRRRSEAALAESHERLRLALDGAELGVWSVDPSTGSFENDARDRRIHGHEPDAPPKTLTEARSLIHPDDLALLDAAFVASKRSGGSFKAEYRLASMGGHRHAGRERWVAVEGTVVCSEGRPLRLLGITRDITERKQAELALAERNAQLALAGQAALVGSYTYESDLERMTVSEGYTAMHGLPEGTTETTRSQWRARVHPEDLEQVEELRARTFRAQGKVYNVEYRIVRAGGEVRWIDSRSFVSYDGDGYPRRVIGINIDFTERKRTEALLNESKTRLSDALAAGQVVAFEWDAATGRTQRSDNADRVIGCVEDGRFLSQVHVDDRDNFRTLIRGLSPGNPSYALTFRFVRSDGRQAWLEEAAKGDFDRSTGRLLRINGLTRDITERKELEDHKNTLISELDHRVKNVLAIVSTVASRTQETSSSMSEFVSALDGRIKSMATTHELLSFRGWQGIPLAELVGRELAPYATTSNTRIAGRDALLSAEASQTLAMVFHELATNAAKFGALSAATGHVSVRWSFRQNGHAERWLCIDWEESGGPVVVRPTRSGFGTSVVHELVPYELGGSVDLVHAPEGVHCKLQIPAHWLSASNRPGDLSRELPYAAQSASGSR